ncbi:MAG: response regulator [Deltaproteobacteria bacterium]|nr:response regulator [Deltaproteobacteria bacterium]
MAAKKSKKPEDASKKKKKVKAKKADKQPKAKKANKQPKAKKAKKGPPKAAKKAEKKAADKAASKAAKKAARKAETKAAKKAAKKGEKAEKKTKRATAENGGAFPSPKDVHLLVVDDEPEVLNLLVPFLRKRGYTVSEAEDGDQALEKILTDRPNVVLLDVMMPGLNGWEISQYVRDRPELDPVRIIMATGIGEEMNAATAPLYGADAFIDKPFRLEDVERTLRDVLHRIETGQV